MSTLTAPEATELAGRIVNTLRPTPPLTEWVEELTGLNKDRAWRTYRNLRGASEHGLTIGTYVRTYRDDLANERRRKAEDATPDRCGKCNATGWISATSLEAHHPPTCQGDPATGTCHCHAANPCRCSNGQRMEAIHSMILEKNADGHR
jgi:hypothetical protein